MNVEAWPKKIRFRRRPYHLDRADSDCDLATTIVSAVRVSPRWRSSSTTTLPLRRPPSRSTLPRRTPRSQPKV